MKAIWTSLSFTLLLVLLSGIQIRAVPMPSPIQRREAEANKVHVRSSVPTPVPRPLSSRANENEIFEFYRPIGRWADERFGNLKQERDLMSLDKTTQELIRKDFAKEIFQQRNPTPAKRDDNPSVPLSQLGPPSFPAQYPSCYNCQQKYSSISSCMQASSVFENATNIFNSPWSYIAVIKCACTDTFQAVYPQCVQCFQLTDQCYYLGTDPKGTGAPQIVTNIRQICAFGSSLLGGVQSANYPDYNNTFTVSTVPSYTDVTQTGPGYYDQATGAIFGTASHSLKVESVLPILFIATVTCLTTLLFV